MQVWYPRVRLFEPFQNIPLPFFCLFPLKTLLQESATYMALTYVVELIKSSRNMS